MSEQMTERASCFFQSNVGRAVDEVLMQHGAIYRGHRGVAFAREAARQLIEWAKEEENRLIRLGNTPD